MNPASGRDLVARSYTDMSYKYFFGLNPEDDVIASSLLTVFRRQRMKDIDLMDMLIGSTIDKAKALGLLSSKKIIIDSTHTLSVFKRYTPSETMICWLLSKNLESIVNFTRNFPWYRYPKNQT